MTGRIALVRTYDARHRDTDENDLTATFLVDRLWPRGVAKHELRFGAWLQDVAPSPELRRWFGHDTERWSEFRTRYLSELDEHPDAAQPILDAARHGPVILLYSAEDLEHNQAVVLRHWVAARLFPR